MVPRWWRAEGAEHSEGGYAASGTGGCQSIRYRTLTRRDEGGRLTSGWGAPQHDTPGARPGTGSSCGVDEAGSRRRAQKARNSRSGSASRPTVARVRIEIPSARAETSAHTRSRSACSSRHAARETRVLTRRSLRATSIRSLIVTPPIVPAVFRKTHLSVRAGWDADPPGTPPSIGRRKARYTRRGPARTPASR